MKSLQADLEIAQRRLAAYAEFDRPLENALIDAYRGAEAIQQRARTEADLTLERALDERRLLSKDVERLRGEREHLANEIVFARRGGLVSLPRVREAGRVLPAGDHRLTLSTEMRLILRALFEESFGPRPPVAAPTAPTAPRTLLRAPAPTRRRRSASQATTKTTPPVVKAIVAEQPVEHPEPVETAGLPTTEIPDSTETSNAASIVVPATATVFETETVAEPTASPFEERQAILAGLGIAEIALSEDALDAIETAAPVADQSVEAVETVEASQAVEVIEAVEDIEPAGSPVADVLPDTSDLASEYATHEPAQPLADASRELVSELNISTDPIVEETPPHETPLDSWPLPSLAQTQPTPPASTDSLTQMWDTAVAATTPSADVVRPSEAQNMSPADISADPALPESESVGTETQSSVEPLLMPEKAEAMSADPVLRTQPAFRQLQLVLSPIDSFPELVEIQGRIALLSSVRSLRLRDFRNGVATFATDVDAALNGREFGALLQMLGTLRLQLEGATDDSVELHVEPAP